MSTYRLIARKVLAGLVTMFVSAALVGCVTMAPADCRPWGAPLRQSRPPGSPDCRPGDECSSAHAPSVRADRYPATLPESFACDDHSNRAADGNAGTDAD